MFGFIWDNFSVINVAFILILAILVRFYINLPKNIPPGPRGLPLVGYLPFLGKFPPLVLGNLVGKYGPLYSLYFGSSLILVLNDFEVIKETLVKKGDIFSGRFSWANYEKMLKRKQSGLLAGDGPELRENRRHFMSTFRDLGLGKHAMEEKILDEISKFNERIRQTKGSPSNLSILFSQSVSNVISLLCFGRRFNYDDPISISLVKALDTMFKLWSQSNIGRWLPWVARVPLLQNYFSLSQLNESTEILNQFALREIEDHKRTHVDGDDSDYVHAYLNEMKYNKSPAFTAAYLTDNSRQLFVAGTDTTSNTLLWIVLYMVMYPDVQDKVQKEILEVFGERCPSFSEKPRTPYTEAVIMEVLRLVTIAPLSVLRTNMEATTVRGYNIPKRTQILTNIWQVHHNPEYFPDPNVFKPERFIGEDGKFRNIEQFMPFGIGKRSCVGEGLARMELYLYFTSLLQAFTFHKEEGANLSDEPNYGITSSPNPFRVRVVSRHM